MDWVLHLDSTNLRVYKLQVGRADCTTLLDIRDWSRVDFYIHRGSWNQSLQY